jgi:hypothetical protein
MISVTANHNYDKTACLSLQGARKTFCKLPVSCSFLLGFFFDTEGGGSTLLPNVSWLSANYTAVPQKVESFITTAERTLNRASNISSYRVVMKPRFSSATLLEKSGWRKFEVCRESVYASSESESRCDRRAVSLGVKPHLGLMTRY